jgi:hypothetical protein
MWITLLGAGLAVVACDKGAGPSASAPTEPAATPAPEPEPAPPDPTPTADPATPPEQPNDTPDAPAGDGTAAGDDTGGGGASGAQGKCGGIAGLRCKKGEKCRYAGGAATAPHPDAMGACVSETHCNAAADCEGLVHIMTVGKWACEKHACTRKSEPGSPQ